MSTTLIFAAILTSATAAAPSAPLVKCPDGGKLEGQAPPSGHAQWCIGNDLLGMMRKNGPFKAWHASGKVREVGTFVDGKKHGQWSQYDAKGRLVAESSFHFGRRMRHVQHREIQQSVPKTSIAAAGEEESPQRAPRTRVASESTGDDGWYDDEGMTVDSFGVRRRKSAPRSLFLADASFYSQTGVSMYHPGFELRASLGAVALEAQWGFVVGAFEGLDAQAAALNPTFLITHTMDVGKVSLRFGGGAAIPVHKLEATEDAAFTLGTVMLGAASRTFWDFYLYVPEFPTVVLPFTANLRLPYLHLEGELTTFLPIPITGGSSNLGAQLGLEGGYPVTEWLDAGAQLQVISLKNFDPTVASVSVGPYAQASFESGFVKLDWRAQVAAPQNFEIAGDKLLWGLNLGAGVRL